MDQSVEMSSAETKKGQEDDDLIIDLNGSTSNQFQETSDIITEGNFQSSPLEVANDNIQKSVQILLDCEEGDNTTNEYSSSISLVPRNLRELSPTSFDPNVVSIGPLHYGNENLKKFEGFKRTRMRNLLDGSGYPLEETLAACLRKVNESIQKIRRCYVGISPNISDPELARMMVMDGCFILEVLSPSKVEDNLFFVNIFRDLLLLENQIPFFVLEDIFECTILKSTPKASLTSHILELLQYGNNSLFKEDIRIPNDKSDTTHHIDHILSLLQQCYQPKFKLSSESCNFTCNVVELEKAGVRFKPNKDVSWPLEIKTEWSSFAWFSWFWNKPTLIIPVMEISDSTETMLRNVIAYEQTCEVVEYITSYVQLIDELVDSGRDIAKLVESEIIVFNGLGSNDEVAKMFNNIGKNTLSDEFYSEQLKELGNYYNGYWPRNIAWLRRTYFNNPWNIIALIAGIMLFALTMTQTYFTINPRK